MPPILLWLFGYTYVDLGSTMFTAFASESLTSNYTRSLGVMVVNLIHQIHLNGRALEVYNWNMQMSQVTDS